MSRAYEFLQFLFKIRSEEKINVQNVLRLS